MRPQIVFVHGIAGQRSPLPYRPLAEGLRQRYPQSSCDLHFVDWRDLAFTGNRHLDAEHVPSLEDLLRTRTPGLLSERMCIWLDVFDQGVGPEHPLWSPLTAAFKTELTLLKWMLDFAADVEVYLRDDGRREAIQNAVRTAIETAGTHGPVIVVAHSLGSVICHEVIHSLQEGVVRLFVTLGSPLQFMLYQLRGTGLVTYSLIQHPSLDWLNIYDIKDIVASPLVQDDFAEGRRQDWYARVKYGVAETGLTNADGTQVVSYEAVWQPRAGQGLRVNVAINRYLSMLLAHQGYWHVSHRHRTVIELIGSYIDTRLGLKSP